MQELRGLEDEPRARVIVELRKHHYPAPLSNDHRGTIPGIEALTTDDLRAHHARYFRPRGTILSIAGNFDWNVLRDQVERLLGDWDGGSPALPTSGPALTKMAHVTKDLEQTQVALAYSSVPVRDPDYYAALGAVNVLSGSMSSRLFTEIREKEGLCYAGSRNERAQRTLDLLLRELRRLPEGIEAEEVERVRAGLKSSLIMAQESTSARASALASDWYHLGRVRSFDEIQSAIDGLTSDNILSHVRRRPPQDFTIVTLGPRPLTVDGTPLPEAS
jgi:predicted Zn-dependent peptidase